MHYVIGDVHGCYDEMQLLLKKIERKDAKAQFIFVGDFIDRGPSVNKVLDWCLTNITPDGKYQSVRGNHEQLVIEWYKEFVTWYEHFGGLLRQKHSANDMEEIFSHNPMPQTHFDFSVLMGEMGKLSPKELKQYIDFFASLPYNKKLEIKSLSGKDVTYRIVHSFYEYGSVSDLEQKHANLNKRVYNGNHKTDEIIVHGHTPTLAPDYEYQDPDNTFPGHISYRKNDINVDCGCVFAEDYLMYPISLGAICLETLEEIYARDPDEIFRIEQNDNQIMRTFKKGYYDRYKKKYLSHESKYREDMLNQVHTKL